MYNYGTVKALFRIEVRILPGVAFTLALAAFLLGACTVGPSFRRPEAPKAGSYTVAHLPAKTESAPVAGGAAQRFRMAEKIPVRWWRLFHSPGLDGLIRLGLARNPTLSAARAALDVAYENERSTAGALLYPAIDAKASASREKFSSAAFGQPSAPGIVFNLFNVSASVSYVFDLFGGARRSLEALEADVDYQRFLLEGAYVTLSANIVAAAVKEASLRAQLAATRQILATEQAGLRIMERQYALGGVSLPDVLAQKAQLAAVRAQLPPLEKAFSDVRHQLAVLAGTLPGNSGGLPEVDLDSLRLPRELPVSLPSRLVRQRPDIRASEALLHAASAQIGVATADMLPQITFTGGIGSETTEVHDLLGRNSSIWDLGISLLQPVFHGGELSARRRAAVYAYKQALAQYQETVLVAFQNVADALRAVDRDAAALRAQAGAWAAARESFLIARKQFRLGAVSYLSLLNAERQYRQATINLVLARAARLSDTAALFQALGGGWEAAPIAKRDSGCRLTAASAGADKQ